MQRGSHTLQRCALLWPCHSRRRDFSQVLCVPRLPPGKGHQCRKCCSQITQVLCHGHANTAGIPTRPRRAPHHQHSHWSLGKVPFHLSCPQEERKKPAVLGGRAAQPGGSDLACPRWRSRIWGRARGPSSYFKWISNLGGPRGQVCHLQLCHEGCDWLDSVQPCFFADFLWMWRQRLSEECQ